MNKHRFECVAPHTRACTAAARAALQDGNPAALRDALTRVLSESSDAVAAVVSHEFVEEFLSVILADKQQGRLVLAVLQGNNWTSAAPLVLAFEAAVMDKSDMLDELAPEYRRAATHMFNRLTASIATAGCDVEPACQPKRPTTGLGL